MIPISVPPRSTIRIIGSDLSDEVHCLCGKQVLQLSCYFPLTCLEYTYHYYSCVCSCISLYVLCRHYSQTRSSHLSHSKDWRMLNILFCEKVSYFLIEIFSKKKSFSETSTFVILYTYFSTCKALILSVQRFSWW